MLSTLALLAIIFSPYPAGTARAADPCGLLRDPATRALLSGSLERKLMIQCGEISQAEIRRARRAPVPGGQLAPPAVREPSGVPQEDEDEALQEGPAADVRINNPAVDVAPHTTQSETSVAVNGSTVCVGFNDSGAFGATGNFTGFAFSTNSGTTWTDGGPLPTGVGGDNNFGDPSVVFSVRDNMFYFAALSTQGLSLWKSPTCTSFTYVGVIHAGGGDDKEMMAIDNNPASPFFGRIYVGWTDFNLGVDRERVTFSNNGGATWSAPVTLVGSGLNAQGMWPAIGPNGDVYFAFEDRCGFVGCSRNLRIYKSVNGGVNFAAATNIGTALLRPELAAATNSCGRQALNGNIRNLSSPQIAIHPDAGAAVGYVIHAVYPYDSDGAGLDNSNVFYKRSTDGAVSWSVEKKLNDDATTRDQWFPAVTVNAGGTVVASWYDRRLNANNLNFDRFAVTSTDGGLTFGANTRISDVSSGVPTLNPNFDTFVVSCYHGDYDQVAADANMAYVVWSDDRRLEGTRPDPDVYFDSITFAGPGGGETGKCKAVTSFSFATGETLNNGTTSMTYVDAPDMTVNFTLGGLKPNCVKVEFSAFVFAASERRMNVRALLDGATAGSPSEVQFSGDDDEDNDGKWARSHAFNFEFSKVAPGPHTIKIQWKSFDGGQIFMHRRSVFVHHK